MNRNEFTEMLAKLLMEMIDNGEKPILDYVKRSDEEQARLYRLGLSKCDGRFVVSKHQLGKAADIYFIDDSNKVLVPPKLGWQNWHKRWEELGGKKMIDWDPSHFEV